MDSYVECDEWLEFICSLDLEHPAFARGVELRKLRPLLGHNAEATAAASSGSAGPARGGERVL